MNMNISRYSLIFICSIILMTTQQAGACSDTYGTPVISCLSYPSSNEITVSANSGSISFSGLGSYDYDNHPFEGGNYGIVSWGWYVYNVQTQDYYYVNEGQNYYFNPSSFGPGIYRVDLYVLDDEYNIPYVGSDAWEYGWCDCCQVLVFKSDIQNVPSTIPYGTGINFSYSISPASGWTADTIYLKIKQGSTTIRTYNLTSYGIGNHEYYWDGKNSSGEYVGTGNYTAIIETNKGNSSHTDTTNQFTVYKVTDVQWVTYGTNIAIDDCPAPNGGKRIFPDRLFPADESTHLREVYIEATITPQIENADVYFSWWDVDDPSTDYWPIDENGSVGGDNFGSGETLSSTSGSTDSYGKARVAFTVTMRPGDNYRIASSASTTQLNQMNQTKADNNNPPTGVALSSMLTTWRKLYVEFDTMDPSTISTEPFGVINNRKSTAIFPNTLVDDRDPLTPDWPANSLIGAVLKPTGTVPAPNYVDPFNSNPIYRFYDIASNTSYQVTIVTDYTTDLFDNDALNGPDDAAETCYMTLCNPSNLPYSINTDDQPLSIPDLPAIITGMNTYFNPAYIYVEENYALNINDTFPWQRNSDGFTEQLATPDIPGNSSYWTVCVGFGYEEMTRREMGRHPDCIEPHQPIMGDDDPENEGVSAECSSSFYGYVDNIPGVQCMIYLENMRDESYTDYAFVVTHEVGHLFGLKHEEYEGQTPLPYELGLMGWQATVDYIDYKKCKFKATVGMPTVYPYFSGLNIRYLREIDSYLLQ